MIGGNAQTFVCDWMVLWEYYSPDIVDHGNAGLALVLKPFLEDSVQWSWDNKLPPQDVNATNAWNDLSHIKDFNSSAWLVFYVRVFLYSELATPPPATPNLFPAASRKFDRLFGIVNHIQQPNKKCCVKEICTEVCMSTGARTPHESRSAAGDE